MCQVKTGVELELWVVDGDGRLCDSEAVTDAHERIQPEFVDPLVEVRTEPHDQESALRGDLETTLRAGVRAAEGAGKHLVPLGTPLTASDVPANCERGRLFEAIYGEGIRSAKNCAGTHVHFEKANVVDQLNVLTAADPALALVSSSPYYRGEGGQYSSRAMAYRTRCGEQFRMFCDLWPYVDSLQEWEDRVDRAYEQFEVLAAERGVSAETVAEHFEPEDTVLNPVRLRECQPTVEWRAPDAALPSEVVDLAVDVGTLVAQTERKPVDHGVRGVHADRIGLPSFSTLRELSRRAISDGLESPAVETYLHEMGFDPSAYQPVAPELHGSSTLRESDARDIRLRQARRLREDLAAIAA